MVYSILVNLYVTFLPCEAIFTTDGAPQLRNCPVYRIDWCIPFVLHDIFREHLSIGVSVHIFLTDSFRREARMQLVNHFQVPKKKGWMVQTCVSLCSPGIDTKRVGPRTGDINTTVTSQNISPFRGEGGENGVRLTLGWGNRSI